MIRILCFLVLFPLFSSCVVEFDNPLVPEAKSIIDEELLGSWVAHHGKGERSFLHIDDEENHRVSFAWVMSSRQGPVASTPGQMVLSKLGKRRFMSVRFRNCTDGFDQTHMIFEYLLDKDDNLIIQNMNVRKVQKAIEDKLLAGKVRGTGFDTEIRVTVTSEQIAKFIASRPSRELFDDNLFGAPFTRINLPGPESGK
jgi:hypothetical protein